MMYSATLDKTVRPICRKFCQDVRTYYFPSDLLDFVLHSTLLYSGVHCTVLYCFVFLLLHTRTHTLTHAHTYTYTHTQPMEIFVDDDTKLTLHGLQQYYIRLDEAAKNRSAQTPVPSNAALLLSSLSFPSSCSSSSSS